ncbi:hypothetical protein NM688_g1395 [Phlebia brevispora]|uniref:Uncharacterized protein n=1 Tax=Phlebia brevispora TaxID=194682 RepID=A0ACC1TBQ4_9APHY|nr:hypothetical protein NM688_g1395 [Phlebia brevispora]
MGLTNRGAYKQDAHPIARAWKRVCGGFGSSTSLAEDHNPLSSLYPHLRLYLCPLPPENFFNPSINELDDFLLTLTFNPDIPTFPTALTIPSTPLLLYGATIPTIAIMANAVLDACYRCGRECFNFVRNSPPAIDVLWAIRTDGVWTYGGLTPPPSTTVPSITVPPTSTPTASAVPSLTSSVPTATSSSTSLISPSTALTSSQVVLSSSIASSPSLPTSSSLPVSAETPASTSSAVPLPVGASHGISTAALGAILGSILGVMLLLVILLTLCLLRRSVRRRVCQIQTANLRL